MGWAELQIKEQIVAFGQKERERRVKALEKKRKKRGREALGDLSAALILSPLQRQALNYHYKPESF